MKKIVIYTSPQCGYCKMAKQYLDQVGAEYEEKDVSDPKIAAEAVERSGQMGVSITYYGERDDAKMLLGFKKAEFDEALKQ